MKDAFCTYCHKNGHYQTFCTRKPAKRISRRGKVTIKWYKVRQEFIKANPPDSNGMYRCYLCYKLISPDEVTIDHVLPRSSNPELRYDHSNLKYCCYTCNSIKGSKKY